MQSKAFLDPFLGECCREYFFRMTRKEKNHHDFEYILSMSQVCLVQKIKVFEVNQYCQNN